MLVFSVVKDDEKERRILSCKRKRKAYSPERFNIYIGNRVFNVVKLTKDNINDKSVRRILEVNRNNVLKCNCNDINAQISEYLMDVKPYLKRAILSTVGKEIEQGVCFESLCIMDNDFTETEEYYLLAQKLRKLSIICNKNKDFNNFRNRCYNNWGLNVECLNRCDDCQAYLDLDNLIMNKGAFMTVKNNQILVYADEGYFCVDENVSELLKYEVPKEYACASLYM